jgi:hypothetical protein
MPDLETTVGLDEFQSVPDDAVQAETQQDGSIGLTEALMEAGEGDAPQEPAEHEAPKEGGTKPSGGIKGRLLESERKGYERGQSEAQAAWQAEKAQYEERLQKLTEYELRDEAKKLAAKEHISEDFAMRVLRAERGLAPKAADTRPRDAQGRFTAQEPAESQPQRSVEDRAKELFTQAQQIERMGGPDVMAIFNGDASLRKRVADGEIDFFDIAREYGGGGRKARQAPPAVRGSYAGGAQTRGIGDLSDEEFDRLQSRLEQGVSIDMRR